MVDKETKMVKLSILVLCFALIFIYVLWFYVKWDSISQLEKDTANNNVNTNTATNTATNTTVNTTTSKDEESSPQEQNKNSEQKRWEKEIPTLVIKNIKKEEKKKIEEKVEEEFIPTPVPERKILSWTQLYDGKVEFAEVLGINYKYALKDKKNILFLYLGEWMNNDLVEIANEYKWTIHALDTEYDIKKNELFGDRVLFLNIPEYKDKIVLMVVKYKNMYWLISIDYKIYHQSKSYLKSLFIE